MHMGRRWRERVRVTDNASLQEVLSGRPLADHTSCVKASAQILVSEREPYRGRERDDLVLLPQVVVELEDAADVPAAVAVIRRGPHREDEPVKELVVRAPYECRNLGRLERQSAERSSAA